MAQARVGEAEARKAQAKAEADAREEREWADRRAEKAAATARKEVWARVGKFSRATIAMLRKAGYWRRVAALPFAGGKTLGHVPGSLGRQGMSAGLAPPRSSRKRRRARSARSRGSGW